MGTLILLLQIKISTSESISQLLLSRISLQSCVNVGHGLTRTQTMFFRSIELNRCKLLVVPVVLHNAVAEGSE